MVKIRNIYGDVCTGRKDNAVYQRKYGQAMRRIYNDDKPPASPLQEAQRSKFKEGIAFAESLNKAERDAIKEYMKNRNIGWNDGEPIHWYNWAKSLAMKQPEYRVLDSVSGRYRFSHPAILKIEELDAGGSIVFSTDDLSNILDGRFQEQWMQTPNPSASLVRATTLAGQVYEYELELITQVTISFPCP